MNKDIKNDEIEVFDILTVYAGAVYKGKVTEVEKHGFWLTEDYETEEFISFADVEEIKSPFTNNQSCYQHY